MQGEVQSSSARLAILIDADNANPNLIEPLLQEIATYGIAHVKRIYSDWTDGHSNIWKPKLHKFAIQPIQQFKYTTGKNATDSALIIDAMDLLYTQNFDGFCIVSSDSDFTRLASRIREAGLVVYGFGEKKTPEAFVSACDKFIYVEILERTNTTEPSQVTKDTSPDQAKTPNKQKIDKKLLKLFKTAYEAIAGEDGWANLGPFGAQLNKLSPAFDSRNYGYQKLGALVRATGIFEVRETPHDKSPTAKELHIKLKASTPGIP
ncbi:Maebl [Leptolyngbya sp. 'hensonii']|uniref:NYN domain-containing protein n=1 Tax=Leptolyngbya sp. 'hensonii' TaxID=1922337 RepID=UPI00094F74F2|nr:NYN domain-containing protein [Leptolyngbya sp. 'hensonii']OLP16787.1 Maebl [Leptolyngbya sp. 'hensonii']